MTPLDTYQAAALAFSGARGQAEKLATFAVLAASITPAYHLTMRTLTEIITGSTLRVLDRACQRYVASDSDHAKWRTHRTAALRDALTEYRAAHDLTLRALADRIGVTAQHLNDIEHGRRYGPTVAAWLLARREGV